MRKAAANVLSAVVLALAAVLLLLPYLPPALAGPLVYIGFGALGILLANLLAALLRHGWWRWTHLGALILSLPLICAYVPILPHEPKPNESTLRILSWNVDNFLVSTDTMLRSTQYMQTLRPDIICLQERPHEVKVGWTDIRAALPRHPHAVRNQHEDEVLNLAILSRHPITASGERTFEGSYNKYLWADVAIASDTLRVFSVHLQTTGIAPGWKSPLLQPGSTSSPLLQPGSTSSPLLQEGPGEVKKSAHGANLISHNATLRDEQALLLCHDIQASPHPVVVCGDFNDTPCGFPARRLRSQLTDLSRRLPFCGTFKRWNSILKIDYMMCSPTLRPLGYQLADTPWSDHKLQVGTVGITQTTNS